MKLRISEYVRNPWNTLESLRKVKTRNSFSRNVVKTRVLSLLNEYKQYGNHLKHEIKPGERNYFTTAFNEAALNLIH